MLLFFLLLIQLFEFLLTVFLHIYGRHVMAEGLFAVTLLGFVLVCSGHLSTVSGARFWRYEEQISDIPAIFLLIFAALALIGTIYSGVQLLWFYRERTGITAFSIKKRALTTCRPGLPLHGRVDLFFWQIVRWSSSLM